MAPIELTARTRQRSVPIALLAIAVLLVASRIAYWAAGEKVSSNGVQWVSMDRARSLAESTGKPILYDFTAEWCPPCHRLEDEVFRNPEYAAEINRRFIPVRVVDRLREEGRNSPAVERLQALYRVKAFPTVIFSDDKGVELGRTEGFRSARAFERVMENVR